MVTAGTTKPTLWRKESVKMGSRLGADSGTTITSVVNVKELKES